MKNIIPMMMVLATTAPYSLQAAIVFDNGSSSGFQGVVANELIQRIYEDFTLTNDTIVSGFTWQQHDDFHTEYVATRVSIYAGLPEISTLLFASDLVATRTTNSTGTISGMFYGFDYSLNGLSIPLPAGTYWFGLHSIYRGGWGTGWDTTLGGTNTIVGARIINIYFPPPGATADLSGRPIRDFAFQVIAVPTTAQLFAERDLKLRLYGSVGDSYRVEWTDTLLTTNWIALTNITLSVSPDFIDLAGVGTSNHFYRALSIP